jgi:hypothetical protein
VYLVRCRDSSLCCGITKHLPGGSGYAIQGPAAYAIGFHDAKPIGKAYFLSGLHQILEPL